MEHDFFLFSIGEILSTQDFISLACTNKYIHNLLLNMIPTNITISKGLFKSVITYIIDDSTITIPVQSNCLFHIKNKLLMSPNFLFMETKIFYIYF